MDADRTVGPPMAHGRR